MSTEFKETHEEFIARLSGMIEEYRQLYWRNNFNAESLLKAAADPCNGEHACEEDHEGADCDCDLDCECDEPEVSRQEALIHANLAQAAATMANTYALTIARHSQP